MKYRADLLNFDGWRFHHSRSFHADGATSKRDRERIDEFNDDIKRLTHYRTSFSL